MIFVRDWNNTQSEIKLIIYSRSSNCRWEKTNVTKGKNPKWLFTKILLHTCLFLCVGMEDGKSSLEHVYSLPYLYSLVCIWWIYPTVKYSLYKPFCDLWTTCSLLKLWSLFRDYAIETNLFATPSSIFVFLWISELNLPIFPV